MNKGKRISTLDSFIQRGQQIVPTATNTNQSESVNETTFTISSISDQDLEHSAKNRTESDQQLQLDLDSCTSNDKKIYIDIYKFSNKFVSDIDKYRILKCEWTPSRTNNFIFPYSVHKKVGKDVKCYISEKHFQEFNWLMYSQSKRGIFCKYCFLFAKYGGSHKQVPLKKLVSEPITQYSKLLGKNGDLVHHGNSIYHQNSVILAQNFIKSYENPLKDVRNLLSNERLRQIKENRDRLKPIIESIIFLGKQNIAIRGHRDDGYLMASQAENSITNEGNFREILRFRIQSGDTNLKEHLENTSSSATYISKSTQNEIINFCGEEIKDIILTKIKKAKYYSIIFDETTDISHDSQLSLVLRYINLDNSEIHEDFIEFINCHTTNYTEFTHEPVLSGNILTKTVLNFLTKYDLGFKNCIGIGTDGCTVMMGELKGAVTLLQSSLCNAVKSPCFNHALNLSISKSLNVQAVRNTIGTIKEVIAFFNASSKRHNVLKATNKEFLVSVCETRWSERHDSLLKFKSCFLKVIDTLELISQWQERDSANKAELLRNAVGNCLFIITLCSLADVFSNTVTLSRLLQKKNQWIKN